VIDLGDPVVLTFLVKDASGNPAAAGAVVVTVTLPDGTSATPATTNPTLGTYTATFATTQAGRHAVRWVATGANAQAYTDVFNVSASDPGMIIGLADARAAVGLPTSATAKDEQLRGYIAAATPLMEDIVGPILRRICADTYDGGAGTVRLLYAPVISVESVVESYGNFTRTLTAQPLDGAGFDAYGYTVDLVDGILTRRVSGQRGIFQPGRRNILVSYTAGRTEIGENLIRAAQRLVRWLWEPEQGAVRPDLTTGDSPVLAQTPSGYSVPRDVIVLCGADVRIVGIG
jgi:hypothetical protein